MKKIMILGAGVYQVPLINVAKKFGIYTIVVSIPGNYPGFEIADKVYYEDTRSYEKILEIAKKENIDGIVTAGTDVAIITIGKVCDEMNLKGISFESAQIASNKFLMKEHYEKNNVNTAKFRRIGVEEKDPEIMEKIKDFRFPLIIKAVDTSGSRGITKIENIDEIKNAVDNVKLYTKKDYYLIEEFIEGEEFGAEAFIVDGEMKFIFPHGDLIFLGKTGVPVGHWAPFEISVELEEKIQDELIKSVKAMKLNNCAITADFIYSNNEVFVLEIGGRSGATCLAEQVSIYYNFDFYEKLLFTSLGEDVTFPLNECNPSISKLLISEKDGYIKEIINKNQNDSEKYEIQFDYKVGDFVNKFKVGPDRIGHVIVKGETLKEAEKIMEEVYNNIEIVIH